MTQHDVNVYLWDIKQACPAILNFTVSKTTDDYGNDDMLRSAVERQLILLGEALNKAAAIEPELATSISNVPHIINLRHRLVPDDPPLEFFSGWRLSTCSDNLNT